MERKRLTEEQKNAIRQMHAAGETMTAIVEKNGHPEKSGSKCLLRRRLQNGNQNTTDSV